MTAQAQGAIYLAQYRAGHVARVRANLGDCQAAFDRAIYDPLIAFAELWTEDCGDRTLVNSFGKGELKTRLIKWQG